MAPDHSWNLPGSSIPTLQADPLPKGHRRNAGSIQHGHDEVRNAPGDPHGPGQHLAVNAAWFKRRRGSWEGSDCEADACASRGVSEARASTSPVTSERRRICASRSSKHDRSNCIVPVKLSRLNENLAGATKGLCSSPGPRRPTPRTGGTRGLGAVPKSPCKQEAIPRSTTPRILAVSASTCARNGWARTPGWASVSPHPSRHGGMA